MSNYSKFFIYFTLLSLFFYLAIRTDTVSRFKAKDIVDDCCCKKSTIDLSNENEINVLLNKIVKTRFFKYFRVNLISQCPFWVVSQLCGLEGCGICECDENEIPLPWRQEDSSDKVDLSPPPPGFTKWKDKKEDMWVIPGSESDMSYINLDITPESNTGYDGSSVWRSIYAENCFTRPVDQMCFEERVFYKLISGLHSSISIHIALFNNFDKSSNEWEHNSQLFKQRFEHNPDRIENLYFTFLFVMRAVSKMNSFLTDYQFNTGNETQDKDSHHLVQQLLKTQLMCQPNFDESLLFKDSYDDKANLVGQFKEHFQNISLILNCVTCEKCKLYGKMQTLGLGTALKILFDDNVQSLQRNEIISIFNLLRQLSNSIMGIETLKTPHYKQYQLTYILKNLFTQLKDSILDSGLLGSKRSSLDNEDNSNSPFSISSNPKSFKNFKTIVSLSLALLFIIITIFTCKKFTKSKQKHKIN